MKVETDIEYEFTVTEDTALDFKFATSISNWLCTNMANLTDTNDKTIFGKVNTGFDENTLKTFGKKPVCDVYINNVEYNTDFDNHKPEQVHTIILFYMKGANNNTYMKACELHDYILQELVSNENYRRLTDVVRDTYITNSELMTQPINKKWGVMGAFELTHILY